MSQGAGERTEQGAEEGRRNGEDGVDERCRGRGYEGETIGVMAAPDPPGGLRQYDPRDGEHDSEQNLQRGPGAVHRHEGKADDGKQNRRCGTDHKGGHRQGIVGFLQLGEAARARPAPLHKAFQTLSPCLEKRVLQRDHKCQQHQGQRIRRQKKGGHCRLCPGDVSHASTRRNLCVPRTWGL